MLSDPSEAQAEFNRCCRCPDGMVCLARRSGIHSFSKCALAFSSNRSQLDSSCPGKDRIHRTKLTLGNGYCESFNARFRDELLNGKVFYTLKEAGSKIKQWRRHYKTKRPHNAMGYRPPAPESIIPWDQRPIMH